MYPNVSEFLKEFGIYIALPIQTFGLMLALSFLAAAWSLRKELMRKTQEGILKPVKEKIILNAPITTKDLLISAGVGALIGYKLGVVLFDYARFAKNPQEVILSTDGNWPVALLLALTFFCFRYYEKMQVAKRKPEEKWIEIAPADRVGTFVMIAAIAGIIGAKVFHNLENLDEFFADPVDALLSFSGLTFYGGLIVAAYFVVQYGKKKNIHWTHLADANAPGLMLAYGIGRIGCHLSGDGDWGINNLAEKPAWLSWAPDWLWAYQYPHNVNRVGELIPDCVGDYCYQLPVPVFPTPLYESIMAISLFFVLWALRKRIQTPGLLFSIYLIFNGLERFLIEKIRVNETYNLFGTAITQAEIISTLLVILGMFGLYYFPKQAQKKSIA